MSIDIIATNEKGIRFRASAGSWSIEEIKYICPAYPNGSVLLHSAGISWTINLPFDAVNWIIDKSITEGKRIADFTDISAISIEYNKSAKPKQPILAPPPKPHTEAHPA
jgi:hypothetical protein